MAYGPTGARVSLTATENAVLNLLTRSPDHVYSREEIAGAVFSSPDAVTTVETTARRGVRRARRMAAGGAARTGAAVMRSACPRSP